MHKGYQLTKTLRQHNHIRALDRLTSAPDNHNVGVMVISVQVQRLNFAEETVTKTHLCSQPLYF